jgi:signal transduction histidine kinase
MIEKITPGPYRETNTEKTGPKRRKRSVIKKNNIDKFNSELVNNLEDELIVIDNDYRVIQANAAFLSNHKKGRRDVIGKHCYRATHGRRQPCGLPDCECPVSTVWETGRPARVTHRHTFGLEGDKNERYLDIIASPIRDSKGTIFAVAESMRDITETKQNERQNAEAYRNLLALNKIATAVSHSLDLDTVLASALEKTLEIMNRNTGGILLWNEERKKLCYRVHHSLSKDFVQSVCFLPGQGVVGRVLQTGRAILIDDISVDPRIAYPGLVASEGLRAFAAVPLKTDDRVLGVITIASHTPRKFSADDIQLLDSISSQIAIAVENAMLHQEMQRKEESRGELLSEIFSIQEEERKRIARELHDETSQSLASLAASLEAIAGSLPPEAGEAGSRIRKMEQVAINVLDEIHKLIYELRPSLLDDLGLVAATRWLAEKNLETGGTTIHFKTTGKARRLPSKLETTLFRVIQEAITNIARHAHASDVGITLQFRKYVIRAVIRDNGRGFNVEEAISSRDRPRGLGLLGMKERVGLMNGSMNIHSYPDKGTDIDIEIPIEVEAPHGQD